MSYWKTFCFKKHKDYYYMSKVEGKLSKELDVVYIIKAIRSIKVLKKVIFNKNQRIARMKKF